MKATKALEWCGKTVAVLALVFLCLRCCVAGMVWMILQPAKLGYNSSLQNHIRECFEMSAPAKEYYVEGYGRSWQESAYLYVFEFPLEGKVTYEEDYIKDLLHGWGKLSDAYTLKDCPELAKGYGFTHYMMSGVSNGETSGNELYFCIEDGVLRVGFFCLYW